MHFPNRVKAALNEGRTAYGVVLSWPSPQTVEIVGRLGLDFVQIDGEHGAFSLREIEETCRAADLCGMTTMARVPDISSSTIQQFIDRGVQGIVAPHISTVDQAEQVVRAACFGPVGDRSFGSARGVDYAMDKGDRTEFYQRCNANMVVCLMIEDKAGLENLPQMVKVNAVDFFYIGMNDFSQGLGYPGQAKHPEVMKARARAFEIVHAAGKKMREDFIEDVSFKEVIIEGTRPLWQRNTNPTR